MRPKNQADTPLILYDGLCHLCTTTLGFVIKRDSKKAFRFASLQSTRGQRSLEKFDLPVSDFKTFALLTQQGCFTKSRAALHVIKGLDGFWPILYILILIPRPLRDFFYDWIAKNRYRFFGKHAACFVPSPDLEDRFLD